MALEKITEAQMNANGVVAAPDILNGTAAENKAIFDRMVRNLVAPAYNACVDVVNELSGMEAGIKESESKRDTAEQERTEAEESRAAAEQARKEAEQARENLETGYVKQTEDNAKAAESWAVGGTGTREGENTNNAKYWSEQAKNAAGGGTGDMLSGTYDPQGKAQDVFKYAEDKASEAVKAHNESEEAHPDIRALIENAGGAGEGTLKFYGTIGTNWTEDSNTGAKYQLVAIEGVTADMELGRLDTINTHDRTSEGYAAYVEEQNQFLTYITNGDAETVDGGVMFYIYGDPNTADIPFGLVV